MRFLLFLLLIALIWNWFSWGSTPELGERARAYYMEKYGDELPPKAFETDGCTLFPDSIGVRSFREACLAHDIVYWAGGSASDRSVADQKLKDSLNSEINGLGDAAWFVVRVLGAPQVPFWWRWGYGWPYGRDYTEEKI